MPFYTVTYKKGANLFSPELHEEAKRRRVKVTHYTSDFRDARDYLALSNDVHAMLGDRKHHGFTARGKPKAKKTALRRGYWKNYPA